MATLSKAESRRLYSWWWDSHIPKNSKWLQDNLTDTDLRVKAMIKLIEEDADSFARRAEMYYKKRPELMKLVEEFYRAYRALAERYDHATGALRQAQRTMAEAFPNQIPFAFPDNELSPSGIAPPIDEFSDLDDSCGKDGSSPPLITPFIGKRNGGFGVVSDGGVRKGLHFHDEDEDKLSSLREEVSHLSAENHDLRLKNEKEKSEAESDLKSLRDLKAKLEAEKEDSVLQFQESLRKIVLLETEIVDFRERNSRIMSEISRLESIEENHQKLDKENQALLSKTSLLEQKVDKQSEDVMCMHSELKKLKSSLEDEHMRCVHAEAAFASLENLHSQSMEALRISALEVEKGVCILKETELKKQSLNEELIEIKAEIQRLNSKNVSSKHMMETMQCQISRLEDENQKLEDEVDCYGEAKRSLEEELSRLKNEIKDLESAHIDVIDQIEAVGLNRKYVRESVKDLQDSIISLKNLQKKKEDENLLLLGKIKYMHEIMEKNVVLEHSLTNANIGLENSRLKIKELQETCELIRKENSQLESKKSTLVSTVDEVTSNIEKLTEKNTTMENSLNDAIAEVGELKERLKTLEDSCLSLEDDRSKLQIENNTLTSQVGLMGQNLEDLRNIFAELQNVHSNMEKEKNAKEQQLSDLQNLHNLQTQQYKSSMDKSNSRLAFLEVKIHKSRRKKDLRDEQLQDKQIDLLASEIEVIVVQNFAGDLMEKNLNLSNKVRRLEEYVLQQKERELVLLDYVGRLKKGIQMICKVVSTDNEFAMATDGALELYLQYILDKIKYLQNYVLDVEDEKHSLILEKSVYVTLLQQLGHHIMDLRQEKNELHQDGKKKSEELLALQSEKSQVLGMNGGLINALQMGRLREEAMVEEIKVMGKKISDLQEADSVVKDENSMLAEKQKALVSTISNLREDIRSLESEYSLIFQKCVTFDSLSLIFNQFGSQKMEESENLSNELSRSLKFNMYFEKAVKEMDDKMVIVEAENLRLKNLSAKFEEIQEQLAILAIDMSTEKIVNEDLNLKIRHLGDEIVERSCLLVQKDAAILESAQKSQLLHTQNDNLQKSLDGVKSELDEVKMTRDDLEKKVPIFNQNMLIKDREITHMLESNESLGKQVQLLQEANEDLRTKKDLLELKLFDEALGYEEEFKAQHTNIQIAEIHKVLFEEKVLELMGVCQSLEIKGIIEKAAYVEEVTLKDAQIEELHSKVLCLNREHRDMKAELNDYTKIVSSLSAGISDLENLIISSDDSKIHDEDTGGESSQGGILELQKLLIKIEKLRHVSEVSTSHAAASHDKAVGPGKAVFDSTADTSRKSTEEMKDIQLDQVSSSSKFDFDIDNNNNIANNMNNNNSSSVSDDQMLRLWDEGYAENSRGKELNVDKPSPVRHLKKKMVEKDDSILNQEWNREVVGRLSLDAERLAILQKAVVELKVKIDKSFSKETNQHHLPKSFEFETVRMQLHDAEVKIVHLFETNAKLIERVHRGCSSSISSLTSTEVDGIEGGLADENAKKTLKKKQALVSERAQRGSDKIGRLELELQKLQYILLKLQEEYENHQSKVAERKSRVVLRDYLYGRISRRRKRGHFCGCMGPRSSDD